MTIAIGLVAADGIVIAADTQETIQGTVKTSATKIVVAPNPSGVIAITGAGTAGHLDALAQDISDRARIATARSMEREIRATFKKFYDAHITPLYRFQARFPDPDISVIIGIDQGKRGRVILANEQTAIRRCDRYVSVGVGGLIADIVLARAFIPDLPLKRAALLAAYAIYCVKESVEGCGKNTEVCFLRDGECWSFWRWDQTELDRLFGQYTDTETVLLHHVLGRAGTSDDVLPSIEMAKG